MVSRIQGITVEIGGDTTKLLQSTGKCKQINQGDAVRTEGCQQTPETGPFQYRTGCPEAEDA